MFDYQPAEYRKAIVAAVVAYVSSFVEGGPTWESAFGALLPAVLAFGAVFGVRNHVRGSRLKR